jgi:hypothetical protein
MEKAKVTFQRYVESDAYIFEDAELGSKFDGLSLGGKMLRQFELELKDCGVVGYELLALRERNVDAPTHWFEFVVEFDLLVAMNDREIVAHVQSFYDEYGLTGNFLLGDKNFDN